MSVVIVIPARYASTRYPGKPLVLLRGPDGSAKSLIQRSWEAASAVSGIDRVVVATDDDRIRAAAEAFGAEVVMTAESCANGTERCADALERMGGGAEIVVNLQGDAPLTPAWFVEDLVAGLQAAPDFKVATPVLRCDGAALSGFLADRRAGRVGGTTAVFDRTHRALYFSKEVIPYTSADYADAAPTPVFHHVGCYAYRPDALTAYGQMPEGRLEALEGLEQLRFIENGWPVLCVEVEGRGRAFWELNNPEDVPRIESMLKLIG
ncbi:MULTISPECIES: 3-deoxy-manno-octulosonate cytidylyltransferase [unclassified Meridianimarinicoccus]|uniref:3-deoxy-manno-octulosonate cytidylyltransferase n=1 Tax=unclassified Meridianimarinicoccus TaxID=2923344 RepID=UPI001868FDD1|nr:manno-octulosonate cytidylyltransferase [Fluviibacterium sp. MJW13]